MTLKKTLQDSIKELQEADRGTVTDGDHEVDVRTNFIEDEPVELNALVVHAQNYGLDRTSDLAQPVSVDTSGNTNVVTPSGTTLDVNLAEVLGTATAVGAGVVDAGTQRITHASDDPVTTSVQIMDDWDESDRAKVNPIVGQAGIAAGAGVVGVTVPRVTLASDDPAVTSVQIMDDWDESDRAKVNLIVGQAGIAAGAGVVGVTVPRATLASDDPAVTALQIVDDWDESDRAKVNPIVGQAGIAAGAGVVGVTVPRVTLASDDPAVTSVQIMDDWDETDRCKVNVNLNSGVAVDIGAGNASTGTARISIATDDVNTAAIKTAVEIIDDWDESDRAKVNPIVGQAGIAAGAGVVGVTVPRVTLASDDPAVTSVQIMDDWDESDRAKVNPIVGQAGIAAGAGVVGVTVPRVTLASDDPAVTALQIIDDWDESDRAKVNVRLNAGVEVDIGAGNASTGTARVSIASNDVNLSAVKTAVELIDNAVHTDGSASTTGMFQVGGTDGTNAQILKVDTNGQLYIIHDAIAGEDAVNGWLATKKSSCGVYQPSKTTTTINEASEVILASTEVGAYPNLALTIHNTHGSNAFTACTVQFSPDGTTWEDWDTTTFATLAASTMDSIQISGNSRRYIKVIATAATNTGSSDVWITANNG